MLKLEQQTVKTTKNKIRYRTKKVVMIVIINLHMRVIFRNTFSLKLAMIVIIKLYIRVSFRSIFSLNRLVISLKTFLSCSLIFWLQRYFLMNWFKIFRFSFYVNDLPHWLQGYLNFKWFTDSICCFTYIQLLYCLSQSLHEYLNLTFRWTDSIWLFKLLFALVLYTKW